MVDLRFGKAGLSIEACASLLGISARTVRRYDVAPPAWYVLVLSLLAGELSAFPGAGAEWEGWRFSRGQLCTPEHQEITAGEVRSLPYLRALVVELGRELDSARPVAPTAPPPNVIPFPTRSSVNALDPPPPSPPRPARAG